MTSPTVSCSPSFVNNGGLFPNDTYYKCSRYLGNQYVYNPYDIEKYNIDLIGTFSIIENVIGYSKCYSLLAMFICHMIHPLALPDDDSKHFPQRICYESCQRMQKDCEEDLQIVDQVLSNRSHFNINSNIIKSLDTIIKNNCEDETFFQSNYVENYSECFVGTDEKSSEQSSYCYGFNVEYVGSLSKTLSGKACMSWNISCPYTDHLIDLSGISLFNNFCRNPSNYRGKPWCYTKPKAEEWEYCDIPICPDQKLPLTPLRIVDGNYSEWFESAKCIGICGGNYWKYRVRHCTNPSPKNGGKNCSHLGENLQILPCNLGCDGRQDILQQKWSSYTDCKVQSCGHTAYKYRYQGCIRENSEINKQCLVLNRFEARVICGFFRCTNETAESVRNANIVTYTCVGSLSAFVVILIIVVVVIHKAIPKICRGSRGGSLEKLCLLSKDTDEDDAGIDPYFITAFSSDVVSRLTTITFQSQDL